MAKADVDPTKALIERAKGLLSTDASAEVNKRISERLNSLAASLLLEWIVGDQRFESQSQQTEYWLSRFYEELFVDEQPDAARIYGRFNLTLPRAAYMARLLRVRQTAQWRQAARAEVKAQLERHKVNASAAAKEGQGDFTEFDVSLSPGAADELRVLFDRLAAFTPEKERPRPPKAKPSFGNVRWFSVPADTLTLILDNLPKGDRK